MYIFFSEFSTVSFIDIDRFVTSSNIDVQLLLVLLLLLLLLILLFHELVTCWSWILDRKASEILADDISCPLPESGESLDKSCWFEVPFVEPEAVKLENNDGRRNKSVGRDGRP